ncbi:MAG: tetratricopeptide repeat protein [Verrucomicrobia bacterium]|nr:tetratricopeptide repeat protein [Verrucomicrobiota bacterium]
MKPKTIIVLLVVACCAGAVWYLTRGKQAAEEQTPEKRASELRTQGRDLVKRGEYEEGIECWQECVKLPVTQTALDYAYLGVCYHYSGQDERAARAYEQALSREPDMAPARVAYALSLLKVIDDKQEAWRRANAELAKIRERDRTHPDVLYNLACLYAENGRPEEALRYLDQVIRVDPTAKTEARTEQSFELIRHLEQFKRLVN